MKAILFLLLVALSAAAGFGARAMQDARNAGTSAIGVVNSSNEAGAHRVIATLAELESAMESLT